MTRWLKVHLVFTLLLSCDAPPEFRRGKDAEGEMWVERLRDLEIDAFVRELDVQGARANRWLGYFEKHPDVEVRRKARLAAKQLDALRQGEVRFWSLDATGAWVRLACDPDGSNRRAADSVPEIPTLTMAQGPLRLRGPAIPSPDGTRVAFPAGEENVDIYVSDQDGKKVLRLTTIEGTDASPVWSPDGQFIAYLSDRDRNPEIYVVTVDTRRTRRITVWPEEDGEPRWAKDGSALFFESMRLGRWQIYRFDLETEVLTRVSDETTDDRFAKPK